MSAPYLPPEIEQLYDRPVLADEREKYWNTNNATQEVVIMNDVTLGSISSGTMNPEDLIPAFRAELERIDPAHDALNMATGTDEEQNCALDALCDALEGYTGIDYDGYYFGSYSGDGPDDDPWLED